MSGPSPDPHPVEVRVVDAVAGRDHPPLGDEGAAAGDPLAQEPLESILWISVSAAKFGTNNFDRMLDKFKFPKEQTQVYLTFKDNCLGI
jgi:hypothetical protein